MGILDETFSDRKLKKDRKEFIKNNHEIMDLLFKFSPAPISALKVPQKLPWTAPTMTLIKREYS